VGDLETAPDTLILTAASSNQTLLPDANILLGGSEANRTITLTPAANQLGATTITVTVSDGDLSTSETFLLTVGKAGFAEWSILNALPLDRRGPSDQNGPLNLPNILAYAMGLDPLTATAADLPALKSTDTAAGTVTIAFRRAKNPTGKSIILVGSSSLQADSWNPATIQKETTSTDSTDYELVEAEVSVPSQSHYFLRLQVPINQ
jgi:hypothetical protein